MTTPERKTTKRGKTGRVHKHAKKHFDGKTKYFFEATKEFMVYMSERYHR